MKPGCVWCAAYGLSLLARYLIALNVWLNRGRYAEQKVRSDLAER